MWIFETEKKKNIFLDISSTNIDTLVPSPYQCVETRSTEIFWLSAPPFQPLHHQPNVSRPNYESLYAAKCPTVNTKHFFMVSFALSSFTHIKGTTQRCHSDYWNQPLNIRMRVCYLDSHEAGLCCYLVIHIESLLRPLQLFYFRLWCIYWLSLVITMVKDSVYNMLW
jgi:hypothetical protein